MIHDQFNYILACTMYEDEARVYLEEYDRQDEGLKYLKNHFQTWANSL